MKTRTIILWILILIVIDQTIKIIINIYFGKSHFEIIPSLIEFKPTFNTNHSYVNDLLNKHFGINVGLLPHLILLLFGGILISSYFFYFKNFIQRDTKIIDTSIILSISGIICALIGNVIWENGTLDYVYLKPFFVFDFKDIYGNIGVILFLVYAIRNLQQLKPIKTRDVYLYFKSRLIKDKI